MAVKRGIGITVAAGLIAMITAAPASATDTSGTYVGNWDNCPTYQGADKKNYVLHLPPGFTATAGSGVIVNKLGVPVAAAGLPIKVTGTFTPHNPDDGSFCLTFFPDVYVDVSSVNGFR
ncbi:hypothetical protein D5S17_22855 [Pseudonocardiaceae bacterium YIM PH 21723]|nr:hypothetical protein D5S17_22855 [Pseudonocardiaceae bacterium YIM PH 21723]